MADTHLTAPTRFVEVEGDRFAYRRWGNANSGQPPLLFFQHFRGGLDHWDPVITDGLAAGREVILYNYRGCASSTGTPHNRIEDMADDAAKVIRVLGLAKIDVLGFSIGGFVAQDFTRRHSDLVRKLLLLGTQPRGGDQAPDPRVLEVGTRPESTVDDFLFLFFGPSDAARQAGREFLERRFQRKDQDPPSSPELMQAQIEANIAYLAPIDPEKPFAHLAEITQPTFVLNGVKDVMVATLNSWHLVQNIPDAQLIVYPDAGHASQFQYPKRFVKHAIQFLEE
ncbi:MAG TPA: alpha/beta hydrolase [Dongiaceae bacterium]|nr:alpha/beta hydrolase [Dongiaceae bacterium]